jgi:hypothetical protein
MKSHSLAILPVLSQEIVDQFCKKHSIKVKDISLVGNYRLLLQTSRAVACELGGDIANFADEHGFDDDIQINYSQGSYSKRNGSSVATARELRDQYANSSTRVWRARCSKDELWSVS